MLAVHPVSGSEPSPGATPAGRSLVAELPGGEFLVQLRGIGVRLGLTPVLRGVDLEIRTAEAVGLAGPNGSGKTTLLRVLATLLPPSVGTGTVLGADLRTRARRGARPQIALVGHVPALYPEMSLHENLDLVARLAGAPSWRVDEALDRVGLGGARARRAAQCSQGMLRRAEFARVLLTGPRLLLLDEAHAGLDRAAAGLVDVLVTSVRAGGGAAVVVAHEPQRLRHLVDRMLELRDGKPWGT